MGEGPQTRFTNAVREYAERFPGKDLDAVAAIVSDLADFKRIKAKHSMLEEKYARRTAEEILRDRSMYVSNPKTKGSGYQVQGCVDLNVALCAVLRAKGIPAKFIRTRAHSITLFKLGGEWREADPLEKRTYRMDVRNGSRSGGDPHPGIKEITEERKNHLKQLRENGEYAEGLDAWDIGITGIRDYGKYLNV